MKNILITTGLLVSFCAFGTPTTLTITNGGFANTVLACDASGLLNTNSSLNAANLTGTLPLATVMGTQIVTNGQPNFYAMQITNNGTYSSLHGLMLGNGGQYYWGNGNTLATTGGSIHWNNDNTLAGSDGHLGSMSGLTVMDTNGNATFLTYTGNGSGMTNIPYSGITGTPSLGNLAGSNNIDASLIVSGNLPMGRLTTSGTNLQGAVLIVNTNDASGRSYTNAPTLNLVNSTNYGGTIAGSQVTGTLTNNTTGNAATATTANNLTGAVTNTTGLLTSLPSGLVTNSGSASIVGTNSASIGGVGITNGAITGSSFGNNAAGQYSVQFPSGILGIYENTSYARRAFFNGNDYLACGQSIIWSSSQGAFFVNGSSGYGTPNLGNGVGFASIVHSGQATITVSTNLIVPGVIQLTPEPTNNIVRNTNNGALNAPFLWCSTTSAPALTLSYYDVNTNLQYGVANVGGIASYATNTATIGSTGWTNNMGVTAKAWLTAATSLALYDCKGTNIFTGQTVAALTELTVQPSGYFTGTAITAAGNAHAQ